MNYRLLTLLQENNNKNINFTLHLRQLLSNCDIIVLETGETIICVLTMGILFTVAQVVYYSVYLF